MNSEIAKQRLSEVVRIDTITSSYGDFMATHVPFKQIQLQKEYDPAAASKTYTEEQIYKKVVLNPKDQHQFVLVIGSSGAGKGGKRDQGCTALCKDFFRQWARGIFCQ